MKIDAKIDVSALIRKLNLTEKNVAFATVNALNETLKEVQVEARENVEEKFTVRKEFVIRQAAIIRPFASVRQARPFGEVSVGRPNRLLLADFEAGAQKRPFVGRRVAVPITGGPARPSFESTVPKDWRIAQLRMRKVVVGNRKGEAQRASGANLASDRAVWRGRNRTYLVPDVGIFQRIGKGESRLVYFFDDYVPLPRRLGFLAMARREGQARFRENLERALVREVALKAGRR